MIEIERRDDVLVLTLAHGKAGLLDLELAEALDATLSQLQEEPGSEGIVLTGRGTIFSAGVDLFRLLDGGRPYLERFLPALSRAFWRLFSFPRPVVAAVNGHAIAGGCVLACGCDLRIMAEGEATIGVPELRVGVPFPGVALEILRFAAPVDRLPEWLYLGEIYRPEEALQRGFVHEIVDPPLLAERAMELAADLGRRGEGFAITKRQLRQPSLDRIRGRTGELEDQVVEKWLHPNTRASIRGYLDATLGPREGS
jgi:enoyl-CoA hydratase